MTSSRFKKGVSGNPSGRKPGTGSVAKLRSEIAKHGRPARRLQPAHRLAGPPGRRRARAAMDRAKALHNAVTHSSGRGGRSTALTRALISSAVRRA